MKAASFKPHSSARRVVGLLPTTDLATRATSARAARPGSLASHCLVTGLVCLAQSLSAQEALQQLFALDTGRELRREQLASPKYTLKSGDFRLLATPSLGLDFNDNINASSTDRESDFILQPMLNLDMSYPLTAVNVLTVNLGVGYDFYFDHHENSSWRVQSGSAVSFDIFVKDFVINLHNRMSYVRDSSQEPAVANTSDFGNFENTAGIAVTWILKDASFTLGYDHQNVVSPESTFDSQNRASELFLARASFVVHPQVEAGLEGTVSLTDYREPVLNDNTAYSVGPFVTWQPGTALRITGRGGYTYYHFDQTSASIQAANLSTYYFDFAVTHDATEVFSYGFSAGRNVKLGVESDAIELWYVRPSVTWRGLKYISVQSGFSFEYGDQGAGDASGGLVEQYNWLGFNVGLTWPVMKRLAMGLNYRLTLRSSDLPDRGYTQNLIGLMLTYTPP